MVDGGDVAEPRRRERERFGSAYFREREEKKWKMKTARDSEGEQMRGKRKIPQILREIPLYSPLVFSSFFSILRETSL